MWELPVGLNIVQYSDHQWRSTISPYPVTAAGLEPAAEYDIPTHWIHQMIPTSCQILRWPSITYQRFRKGLLQVTSVSTS